MLEELLRPEYILNAGIGLGIVLVFIALFKVFGMFDVGTSSKESKCSRCKATMSKAEEVASHKYFRKKAYEGRYFCKKCQEILMSKKNERMKVV